MLNRNHDLQNLCIAPADSMRAALASIDRNRCGIALVVDPERRLLGTITDGDMRRAILAGCGLDTPVSVILDSRPGIVPVTASVETDHGTILALMRERVIRQLPLLDAAGAVVEVVTLDDLLAEEALPMQAVVMAGGFGKRLQPLTHDVPKPMLPVGDKPILELIVNQLQQAGIRRLNVTTHYKPEVIREHFGDGKKFGLDIDYVSEEEPRGTAGALSMVEVSDGPIMVMNGDVLTRVDFRAMLNFHREHQADLTVAVRQYDMKVPYGVINCEDAIVRSIEEKPVYKVLVNAGIYLLEPTAHRSIPHTPGKFDMTDLIDQLMREGKTVIAFPIVEYWMDIGQHGDYAQAQEDVKQWEVTT